MDNEKKRDKIVEEGGIVCDNFIIKRCKNIMCGNLIYYYQPVWKNDYCDDSCRQEAIHWRSKNEPRLRRRGRFSEVITHYPHKDYPDTILIIPQNEQ